MRAVAPFVLLRRRCLVQYLLLVARGRRIDRCRHGRVDGCGVDGRHLRVVFFFLSFFLFVGSAVFFFSFFPLPLILLTLEF